jgi:hypothetical protein
MAPVKPITTEDFPTPAKPIEAPPTPPPAPQPKKG